MSQSFGEGNNSFVSTPEAHTESGKERNDHIFVINRCPTFSPLFFFFFRLVFFSSLSYNSRCYYYITTICLFFRYGLAVARVERQETLIGHKKKCEKFALQKSFSSSSLCGYFLRNEIFFSFFFFNPLHCPEVHFHFFLCRNGPEMNTCMLETTKTIEDIDAYE